MWGPLVWAGEEEDLFPVFERWDDFECAGKLAGFVAAEELAYACIDFDDFGGQRGSGGGAGVGGREPGEGGFVLGDFFEDFVCEGDALFGLVGGGSGGKELVEEVEVGFVDDLGGGEGD